MLSKFITTIAIIAILAPKGVEAQNGSEIDTDKVINILETVGFDSAVNIITPSEMLYIDTLRACKLAFAEFSQLDLDDIPYVSIGLGTKYQDRELSNLLLAYFNECPEHFIADASGISKYPKIYGYGYYDDLLIAILHQQPQKLEDVLIAKFYRWDSLACQARKEMGTSFWNRIERFFKGPDDRVSLFQLFRENSIYVAIALKSMGVEEFTTTKISTLNKQLPRWQRKYEFEYKKVTDPSSPSRILTLSKPIGDFLELLTNDEYLLKVLMGEGILSEEVRIKHPKVYNKNQALVTIIGGFWRQVNLLRFIDEYHIESLEIGSWIATN